jgi:hypothetical protein
MSCACSTRWPSRQRPTPAPKAAPGKPFAWTLGELALTNGLMRWQDESGPEPVDGQVRNLQVHVGKVDGKLVEPIVIDEVSYQVDLGERFRVEKMAFKGISVDLPAHRVEIAEVVNSGTRARMLRDKDGKIEWVSSPVLKTVQRATDRKAKAAEAGARQENGSARSASWPSRISVSVSRTNPRSRPRFSKSKVSAWSPRA